jgi:hypothetical protein
MNVRLIVHKEKAFKGENSALSHPTETTQGYIASDTAYEIHACFLFMQLLTSFPPPNNRF